jgi:hypothetical protein
MGDDNVPKPILLFSTVRRGPVVEDDDDDEVTTAGTSNKKNEYICFKVQSIFDLCSFYMIVYFHHSMSLTFSIILILNFILYVAIVHVRIGVKIYIVVVLSQ